MRQPFVFARDPPKQRAKIIMGSKGAVCSQSARSNNRLNLQIIYFLLDRGI